MKMENQVVKEENNQEVTAASKNFEKILRSSMELPYIKIDRASFLRKELSKYFIADVVDKAIATTPAQAGISVKGLEQIAKSCINNETSKVTAVSAAAGIPGFKAMAVTVPADVVQFYGHIIRVLQKLAYLYGWQELLKDESGELDDETTNQLTIFIGAMFGVNSATAVLSKIANSMTHNMPKKLMSKALTHGTIYPVVKKIAKVIGIKMTKKTFASAVGKAIPIVGAIASGGVTYTIFKPMAVRLKKHLADLPLADVDFYKEPRENSDTIDIDFSDIDLSDDENKNVADVESEVITND